MSAREGNRPTDRMLDVLERALECPESEREQFVRDAYADDEAIAAEVLSLLRALATGGAMLEPPPPPEGDAPEPLTGLRFGSYTVGSRIGAGGMGVVYEADDTRLGRRVAVKALPPSLAGDAQRRARFEQEARVVASLNHPNIGAIYGVEDTPRGPVMVLELIPGPTLAARLQSGRLAVPDAVRSAVQIARALEAAHAAGIVHRDLKPANIKLAADGTVKVLDFGVAKVVGSTETAAGARSDGPPHHTRAGDMIGTAAYMSPEQASGKPVDRRADLWAFGCVLYEMLSGRRAFAGATVSETIASVLSTEPDWGRLPPQLPAGLTRLLRRCLEKDPDRRLRDAGDARLDLEESPDPAVRRTISRRAALAACAAFAAGGGATAWYLRGHRAALQGRHTRALFLLELPGTSPLWVLQDGAMALAPDGSSIVFAAGPTDTGPRLFERPVDGLESAPVAGIGGAMQPFLSADGRWLGYYDTATSRLVRVERSGGTHRALIELPPGPPLGASFAPDGSVVYGSSVTSGLHRIGPDGGEPAVVTARDIARGEFMHAQPDVLPGGRDVVFASCTRAPNGVTGAIEVVSLSGHGRRVLIEGASQPRFVEPRTLLFVRAGVLMAVGFDSATLRVEGEPSRVVSGLASDELLPYRRYDAARSGDVLVYLDSPTTFLTKRVGRFGLDGSTATVLEGTGWVDEPRFSPDGSRLVVQMGLDSADVWTHDLVRGTTTRLTTGTNAEHAVWSPDGARIVYRAQPTNGNSVSLESVAADGSSAPETLWQPAGNFPGWPSDFAPGGGKLAVTLTRQGAPGGDLALMPADGGTPEWLFAEPAHRIGARFSPDGSMVAYSSSVNGRMEVFAQPFPALDRRVQVSVTGGYRPAWSRDGRRLFFRLMDRLYIVDVEPGAELRVSPPRLVLEHIPDARFDVSPDGQSVVMGIPTGGWEPVRRINVEVGWRSRL